MRILITNDDGYNAKGIKVLAEIMKQYGEVTVIAPKTHQSGMSMAVSLGFKQIAHKDLGEGWHYVDATPASCVKFGLNTMFLGNPEPDDRLAWGSSKVSGHLMGIATTSLRTGFAMTGIRNRSINSAQFTVHSP